MSTATDITLSCGFCAGDIAVPDVADRTCQQWQCPNCDSWNNWMKTTTQDDDATANVTQRVNQRFNVCATDGAPIPDSVVEGRGGVIDHSENIPPELFGKFAAEIQHIANRRPVLPGMGKSKAMKKWLKKGKKGKLKWKKLKAVKIKPGDMTGFLTPSSNPPEFRMPPWYRPDPVTQRVTWDLRDTEGDLHSPSWYLDAYLVARQEYQEAWQKVSNAGDDNSHDAALDYALEELDRYGTYINKLFGSDMVDGVWNRSDEDQ